MFKRNHRQSKHQKPYHFFNNTGKALKKSKHKVHKNIRNAQRMQAYHFEQTLKKETISTQPLLTQIDSKTLEKMQQLKNKN